MLIYEYVCMYICVLRCDYFSWKATTKHMPLYFFSLLVQGSMYVYTDMFMYVCMYVCMYGLSGIAWIHLSTPWIGGGRDWKPAMSKKDVQKILFTVCIYVCLMYVCIVCVCQCTYKCVSCVMYLLSVFFKIKIPRNYVCMYVCMYVSKVLLEGCQVQECVSLLREELLVYVQATAIHPQ
jgi:hypothetical protein